MTSVHLIVSDPYTLVALGPLDNLNVWLALLGLAIISTLFYHGIEGSIVIGIFVISLITWWSDNTLPTTIVQWPTIGIHYEYIDFTSFDAYKMIPAVLSFLFIGMVSIADYMYIQLHLCKCALMYMCMCAHV